MKKILMAIGAMACVGLGGVVGVLASGSNTPEVDRASAKITLTGSIKPVQCVGEDSGQYSTWAGSYSGSEAQVLPDPTDYNLNSSISISAITWTIHQGTGGMAVNRGVFTGVITLSTSAGGPVYKGGITLITQGFPSTGGPPVPARGWINARFVGADDGVPNTTTNPNDDTLLANVEFRLAPTSATGQFGSAVPSLNFPDFSAVSNALTAPEGRC